MLPALNCEIITSEKGFQALSSEWRTLQATCGQTPFTDFDWIDIWWRELARPQNWTLHIVIGRKGGKLVAVLPLAVQRQYGFNILRAVGHKAFHYCDILCSDEQQAIALWAAAKASPHYDFADIRDIYPESMSHKVLSPRAHRRDITEAFLLRLNWKSTEEWRASQSKDMRGKANRCLRRLQELGPVTFNVYQKGVLPKSIVDGMVRQKAQWSRDHHKKGIFNEPSVASYFEKLVTLAAQDQRVMLMWLTCGDQIIAYNLGLIYQNALHGYVITHDPEYSSYGPGILMIMRSIEWSIEQKLSAVDHRQGDGSYKSRFSNETRYCSEFTFSNSLAGDVLERTYFMARSLRRKLPRPKLVTSPSTPGQHYLKSA